MPHYVHDQQDRSGDAKKQRRPSLPGQQLEPMNQPAGPEM
jgi:hypothetical protein